MPHGDYNFTKQKITSIEKDVEKLVFLCIPGGNIKMVQLL